MRKAKKWLMALICTALLLSLYPVTASADMGPKPSVTVNFENVGDELCYATLLSDKPGTGPWIAWDGTSKTAFYAVGENHATVTGRVPYEIWKAFVDHKDEDGFYFLQFADRVDETGELSWSYYPPEHFKILVYYAESGRFAVSGILHRHAFHARFRVDLANGAVEKMRVEKSVSWSDELPSFLFRLALTLVVELGIALLFSIRARKQLICIIAVNLITQLLLNIVLTLRIGPALPPGVVYLSASLYLPVLELLIVILEALAYCLLLNHYTDRPRKKGLYIIYAAVANIASLVLGLVLSFFLPGMF